MKCSISQIIQLILSFFLSVPDGHSLNSLARVKGYQMGVHDRDSYREEPETPTPKKVIREIIV